LKLHPSPSSEAFLPLPARNRDIDVFGINIEPVTNPLSLFGGDQGRAGVEERSYTTAPRSVWFRIGFGLLNGETLNIPVVDDLEQRD
jgi:hypothetical protein